MGRVHLYPYPLPIIIQGTEHRSWLLMIQLLLLLYQKNCIAPANPSKSFNL